MIELNEIVEYCLAKPGASLEFPFGDIPVCIKYKGKIFAEIYPDSSDYKITLRCDPLRGEYYRQQYPRAVIPGYHVPLKQRRFKNTILLNNEEITKKLLFNLIDESYETLQT